MEIQYKILIIDDSPTSLLYVTRTVEKKLNGVKVYQAQSAKAGFALLEEEDIDLILMDVQMPEINGFEATRLIQQNPKTFHIPVIFLTAADPNLEYMPKGLDAGGIDYLTKPISDKELVNLLSLYFRFIRRERAINAELDAVNKRLLTEIDERKDIERELQVLNEKLEQRVAERTKALEMEASDRELAEDALRDSEMKYRLIFDNSPVGILHFRFDSTISACNKAFAAIVGAPKERLIGFNMLEQMKNKGLIMALKDALNGKHGIYEGDYETVTSKKNIIIKVIFKPLIDDEEMVIGGIGIIHDISDTKKAEVALKRSEAQFRSVWVNSLDGMRITDAEGTMIMANAAYARLFGKKVEDLVGKNFTICYAAEDREYFLKRYQERFTTHSIHEHIESEMELWNGNTVYLELLNSYLGYSESDSNNLLTIVRDISDRKRSEAEMKEAKENAEAANMLKSNLLANMSHEFRTPLNGILGFASILEEEVEDEEQAGMIQKIERSGKRLMRTLNSILELSYLETPVNEISMEKIELDRLIEKLLDGYRELAGSKNLDFVYAINEKSLLINGHEELLGKVFENLMDNAVKYTDKGRVELSLNKLQVDSKEFAAVCFKDTGIGIEEDMQEVIFQEFRQVSEGFGRTYEGTGLGLTLVNKIMKLMGGSISVESKPNEGSLFTVLIPLVVNGEKKLRKKSKVLETSTSEQKGSRKRLLLVEDNKINEEITVLFLNPHYDIDSVNDGKSALRFAEENTYDAFLLDIHLEDEISGVDIAEKVRKMDKYKEVPIAAITGYAMAGDREYLLSAGFTHYLAKPFQKEELLETLAKIFNDPA